MRRKKIFYILFQFALLIILAAAASACSSSKQMTSIWQQEQIQMKGGLSFWRSKVFEIPDKKFGVGFANDDRFMYLCLTTDDRTKIFQIFRNGFIVWFEPESSNYKTFGIKYPLVNAFDKPPQINEPAHGEMQGHDNQGGFGRMLENQNEFEIVNQDKYPLLALPLINKEGIEPKLSFLEGRLIYELKIPLAVAKQYSFVAGALPGEKIKVRFETLGTDAGQGGLEQDHNGTRPQDSGGGRASHGGGAHGRGGGGGVRPGGIARSGPEPINYTIDLQLEKAPVSK